MDPVRGAGQALDALQVGHVVVLGLGQLLAEVAVALLRRAVTAAAARGVASTIPAASMPSSLVARRKASRFIARPWMLAAGDNLGCRGMWIADPEVWQWRHTGFTVMSGDSK
jgi:hypothetical protein